MKGNYPEIDKISTNFTQFIIAVNGTLIAYAIKQVESQSLELKFIPLGLAILFWGMSFYFGISSFRNFLSSRVNTSFKNYNARPDSEAYQIANKQEHELLNSANDKNKKMYTFLYLGGVFYILWQLAEMIINTYCK